MDPHYTPAGTAFSRGLTGYPSLIYPPHLRALPLAHSETGLWLHLEWGRSYYHFARVHESLRIPTSRPGRFWSRTPAMAARVTRKRWSVQEIILLPLQPLEGV